MLRYTKWREDWWHLPIVSSVSKGKPCHVIPQYSEDYLCDAFDTEHNKMNITKKE